ncbi:MAG: hypothetical protein QHC90_25890 [Shinella sp.]|nr:hypothetical protein [Shinella sp.]
MNFRPPLFSDLGEEFAGAFGNVDAQFTIAGVLLPRVRAILRQWRELDLGEEQGQAVEGTTHLLSVAADMVPGLVSQRDSVTIFALDAEGFPTGISTTFEIKNHSDDARAMVRIYLSGDI